MLAASGELLHGELRRVGPARAMTDAQFARWAQLVERRTGISLPAARKSFLVTGLGARMRELGYEDYESYYHHLTSGPRGEVEWQILVDRLTVHETRFFRDPAALALVRDGFLPARLQEAKAPVQLRVWSVGCATGEEAYSLAMVMERGLREAAVPAYYGVTATDVSGPALVQARRGVYSRTRVAPTPPELVQEYLVPVETTHYRVGDALRERVCFMRLNVLDIPAAHMAPMDLIYCQNLLIYFQQPRRLAILDSLVARLRPGGLLILGAGEIVGWRHPHLHPAGYGDVLAFRRVPSTRNGACND